MPNTIDQIQHDSKFHWLFLSEECGHRNSYDTPIKETENFVVLPSLGSIVSGWLLIVPKFPVARIADIPECHRLEFLHLTENVRNDVEVNFTQSFIFEHGGFKGSPVSCGVDQAHLHVVPLEFDLLEIAQDRDDVNWQPVVGTKLPTEIESNLEYLFVASNEHAIFSEVTRPSSQWFRKLIANQVGCPGEWDYRYNHFNENIKKTVQTLGIHG